MSNSDQFLKNQYLLLSEVHLSCYNVHNIVKVNQSHYRPEVPRGFQEVQVPILRENGPGWWQGCQPYAPAAFTHRKYSWYSFILEAKSTPGP